MIVRETDAERLNRVSNSPEVAGGVNYRAGPMDWAEAIGHPDIIVLSDGGDACAVFARTNDRIWQAHTMFGAACRGRKAVETGKAMLREMRPVADLVWGATPVRNCAARWFNRQLGAMPIQRDTYAAEGEVEICVVDLRPW